MDDKLLEIITNPETGFVSSSKIHENYPEYSLKEIKEAQRSLNTYQINDKSTKNYYNTIKAYYVGDVIQSDLMDVSNLSTSNNKVKFLLTFIDVYSRYVLCAPLQNKNMVTVKNAMEYLINKFKYKIKNITTDDGKEFNNKIFSALMKSSKIKHHITDAGTPNKLAIIERFHRTLRNRMDLYFDHYRTKKYIDVLPKLIKNYNTSIHSTIKRKPIDVYLGKFESDQKRYSYDYGFKVGDRVRKKNHKSQFDKGSSKFSSIIYTIFEIHDNSYSLRNEKNGNTLKRRFLGYELQHVPQNTIEEEKYDSEIKSINRKKYLQKREPAFNDKNTHTVSDYGEIDIHRRHLKPKYSKRKIKPLKKLDL